MRSRRLVTGLMIVVALGLVACSKTARLSRHADTDHDLRAEYLRNNPDGEFTSHVLKGEVVKGMGLCEVIAAWGVPNVRLGAKATLEEHWVYYVRDEVTLRIIGYDLTFVDQRLDRWHVDKNVTDLGTLTFKDFIPIPTTGEKSIGKTSPPPPSEGKPVKKRP